jgi:hypothetical protein
MSSCHMMKGLSAPQAIDGAWWRTTPDPCTADCGSAAIAL